ncbi:uncharacterized protein F5891DRAFT_1239317 [Suillus fuscotomentosus]|uniref:DUF6570 domain-containing protein n=1 Tax=Suillus fuscotomentosus TaxID=1912939 RepID=A0AAD4E4Y1_9AGAM|nr:uncharacterized protein F5891DRAFT_1239317 [Suillus fuscotomentosus]KAG1898383.1 hypothetical protein F5891DRAFT_1239317 [Suillus fuscotomentosus]
MLERAGIVDCSSDCIHLFLCSSCCMSLLKPDKVPWFALANNLYRGQLPLHLQDISWVEEKVCAIYRVTAHVTRLFQSSDPAQPKVFHGNTCAHDMNIVSTASVLLRMPSDVNGLLSIVFIGPGKFDAKWLGTVFRVCIHKIWSFLLWLKHHNRLYAAIPLDSAIISMYPDDDILPGLSDIPPDNPTHTTSNLWV